MKRLIAAFVLLLPMTAGAITTPRFSYSPLSPRQGDTIIVALAEKPTSLTWNGSAVTVFPYQSSYRGLIPLPATQKIGTYPLVATFADGKTERQSIAITKTAFVVINLPVPEKLNETPAQLVTSLASVNKDINKTVSKPTEKLYFNEPFALPLYNNKNIGSQFGEVRKTGPEEIRHLGTDFTAKTGTPVAAINAGVVTSSYLDTTYGNTVIIDHGYGIYTLYMHLSVRKAKVGDVVTKGTIIGLVGETGYASGPHLHLSVKINGTSVDPLRFVQLFK